MEGKTDKTRVDELIQELRPDEGPIDELEQLVWKNQNKSTGDGSFDAESWNRARDVLLAVEELQKVTS